MGCGYWEKRVVFGGRNENGLTLIRLVGMGWVVGERGSDSEFRNFRCLCPLTCFLSCCEILLVVVLANGSEFVLGRLCEFVNLKLNQLGK